MKQMICLIFLFLLVVGGISLLPAQTGQTAIQRIELMPNEPSPYIMRDWNKVATAYDSFVYDIQRTGEHLPLVFIDPQGTNYPERPSFGLDTYVGTFSPMNGEAINVLPSLVGATLAGVDKTNQFGMNWILMSQDYFNRANGEFLYLNNIGGHSGHDWWYDMMPNIYFYQLYDLYGKIGDTEFQFHKVAEQMSAAVRALGGKDTPWRRASMNYRAWNFLQMQPNPDGVHEPEAAGAFAWLLYHAYKETGNPDYLKAAEWSMEFLINLGTNPSYELQLPYGAYIAAKMNAEIGTEYNIEKLLFWIFNRGPLRGWGTIVGTWNNFDVSGLVGEANDAGNDYAFQLNGTQQAGALAPLARYDKRFARAIGKWILNVANATRLMYPEFLPAHLQDASLWSAVYDPQGVVGYEALREVWTGLSPFSTGDALKGGWAATNLSLYSSSSIGYLGSIIEKTSEDKILQIDLLKTDFFNDPAYPSYLYFNPYQIPKTISVDVGSEPIDVYDALSESFLSENVTGEIQLEIPADQAISVVFAPAGGTTSYDNNKMLIDGIPVDFMQTFLPYNYPPRIQAFATENYLVEKNSTLTLYAKGIDQETKDLIYTFYLPGDTLTGLEKNVSWTAPDVEGIYELKLVVEDEAQQRDTAEILIEVVSEINSAPEIHSLSASKRYTSPGGTIIVTAEVTDLNNDPILYTWSTTLGEIIGSDAVMEWVAPDHEGISFIHLMVSDGRGGTATATIKLLVLDPDMHIDGDVIAWYPFQGNAQDISGNALHGQVFGAKLTEDSLGAPSSAYFFDGINDHIRVTNEPVLNFMDGITVTLFAQPQILGDKERFMISHGSWQNRWKLSITPEQKVRWTLKNTNGQVRDLDSENLLETNKYYHIAGSYDGRFMLLYINGQLENFTAFTGDIQASPVDLEIGQILPDDPMYSFRGVMDEIKIFDYALRPDSVAAESGMLMTSVLGPGIQERMQFFLYPNPARGSVTLDISRMEGLIATADLVLSILDNRGLELCRFDFNRLSSGEIDISKFTPGLYQVRLSGASETWVGQFIIAH